MSEFAGSHRSEHDPLPGDATLWRPALDVLWSWIEIVLEETPIAQVDAAEGRGLCALALEVYAPALVIEMEASGMAAGVLLFARLAERYSDRCSSPLRRYTVCRLRTVVRSLRQCTTIRHHVKESTAHSYLLRSFITPPPTTER